MDGCFDCQQPEQSDNFMYNGITPNTAGLRNANLGDQTEERK
jgi:hypothetical protein